jgi:hypothetical protein
LIRAYEESALAEVLGRVQEFALDVVHPLTIATTQDSPLVDERIFNVGRLFPELCMHGPAVILGADNVGIFGTPVIDALQQALMRWREIGCSTVTRTSGSGEAISGSGNVS